VGQYFTVTLTISCEQWQLDMIDSGALTLLNGLSNPELMGKSRRHQSAPQAGKVVQGPGFVEEFQDP